MTANHMHCGWLVEAREDAANGRILLRVTAPAEVHGWIGRAIAPGEVRYRSLPNGLTLPLYVVRMARSIANFPQQLETSDWHARGKNALGALAWESADELWRELGDPDAERAVAQGRCPGCGQALTREQRAADRVRCEECEPGKERSDG